MSEIRKKNVKELLHIYYQIKPEIMQRLKEFEKIKLTRDEKAIFKELVFCLLTPQSKAETCWNAVVSLENKGLLWEGDIKEIREELKGVRFHNNKAKYIKEVQSKFVKNKKLYIAQLIYDYKDPINLREWLIKNIKGMGYKEASHFLRNIGLGRDLAILDRHILKNLRDLGVIKEIPKTLSKNKYLKIEEKMRVFSKNIGIPLDHLDLLLWFKQTGRIFK